MNIIIETDFQIFFTIYLVFQFYNVYLRYETQYFVTDIN